jgi:hypothetical protein
MQPKTIFIRSVVISFAPKARKANTMQFLQNRKRKSVARHATTLLAALALGTAVTTAALAAGHGGGGGDGDHRFGSEFHDRDRRFGERFGGGGFAYAPGYDDYGYDGACYQYREVYTIAGWLWRQLWVCN